MQQLPPRQYMYSRNRATPSAFMTSAGSTPTPFGRTWNWSATSRENAWTALHQPETREVDGIVIIHPNWWGQPRLGVTEGGKEHFFTAGGGHGFCMPEYLRTSLMPTSCRSREESHGWLPTAGARLNRSGLVMRVKMTRLIWDLGTVLAP